MIPYSKFLEYIDNDKVAEVAITSNQIQGKLKAEVNGMSEGTVFRTVRVDPEISKQLDEHDITFKGEIEYHIYR